MLDIKMNNNIEQRLPDWSDDVSSNSVNNKRSNMVVAVRIRPISPDEILRGFQKCCKVLNNKLVVISRAGIPGRHLRSQQGSCNEYQYDFAFDDDTTQSQVYEQTAKLHVPEVLDGYNVTVFAYGATGAGKTHTMMGSERTGEEINGEEETVSGIIPQSLVDIFANVQHRRENAASKSCRWQVYVSYLEVYNEQIYDLIGPVRQALSIREDASKGVIQVSGLSEIEVGGTREVLELLRLGNRNRKTESTAANVVSSRSHAVLQILVKFSSVDVYGNDVVRESKLSLIDLAGSERASATLNRGARLQEGANINKSLLALANCINALAENSTNGKAHRKNVKYRDSKLTHLLKSSLEGDCKLIMIANINPCDAVFEDSHNTLKYANRAKQIKIKPGTVQLLTQEVSWPEREARLQADNQSMRKELAHLKELLTQLQQHNNTGFHLSPTSLQPNAASLKESDDMEIVDDEFSSIPQDLTSKAVHDSTTTTTRMRELEAIIEEMARTRHCMEQLVSSLKNQLQEKERELQAQKTLACDLQQNLRAKDEEVQSLREKVVYLRTRLESNYAFTDEYSEDEDFVIPLRKPQNNNNKKKKNEDFSGAAAAATVKASLSTLHRRPTRSSISKKRKSSLKTNINRHAAVPLATTLLQEKESNRGGRKSSLANSAGKGSSVSQVKRRQSQIPRPSYHYSTRRTSMMVGKENQGGMERGGGESLLLAGQRGVAPRTRSRLSLAPMSEQSS